MSKKPKLPDFNINAPLVLNRLPNGGWMVAEHTGNEMLNRQLGAFSTAEEMLDALTGSLTFDDSE